MGDSGGGRGVGGVGGGEGAGAGVESPPAKNSKELMMRTQGVEGRRRGWFLASRGKRGLSVAGF